MSAGHGRTLDRARAAAPASLTFDRTEESSAPLSRSTYLLCWSDLWPQEPVGDRHLGRGTTLAKRSSYALALERTALAGDECDSRARTVGELAGAVAMSSRHRSCGQPGRPSETCSGLASYTSNPVGIRTSPRPCLRRTDRPRRREDRSTCHPGRDASWAEDTPDWLFHRRVWQWLLRLRSLEYPSACTGTPAGSSAAQSALSLALCAGRDRRGGASRYGECRASYSGDADHGCWSESDCGPCVLTREVIARRSLRVMTSSVQVVGLHVARGGNDVLHGLTFAIERGVVCGLLGPSGGARRR